MKKKILFVMPTLDLGGAEKSLVNLLNELDYTQYEVDLFLFYSKGIFLDAIPKSVNLLENTQEFRFFSKSLLPSIFIFLLRGKFALAYSRLWFAIKNRTISRASIAEQKTWKYTKEILPKFEMTYDLAIGYLEKTTYYYVADNVKSHKKVGWIHTDLEALELDFDFENSYFDKLDYLVTVSDGLKERLIIKVPTIKNKLKVIENINSVNFIRKLADSKTDVLLEPECFKVLFVGRLVKEKGLFMAIDAIKILIERKIKVKFYLIGNGNLETELLDYVKKSGLQSHVVFLGMQSNPYPLIKQAHVFLLTSFYEGKSIALEEAKILLKPIVVTNFTSAKDQIKDCETGIICEMNPESIAEKLLLVVHDQLLQERLIFNLNNEILGNDNEIEKLYRLIND